MKPVRSILLAIAMPAGAAITPYSEDFSSGPGSLAGWTSIGTVTATIQRTTSNRDGDATTPVGGEVDGGGDDVAGDGALYFPSSNSTPQDETIAYTLTGTMERGEVYTLDISTFNPTTSYNNYNIQLVNKTDGTILTGAGAGQNGNVVGCRERILTYVATVDDEGDDLEIRIRENHNSSLRQIGIDRLSLTVDSLSAGVVAAGSDFSGGSVAGWLNGGAVATNFYHTTSNRDGTGGDGTAADGALYFNTVNNTPQDEEIRYALEGSMIEGETYTLDISLFNPANSFNAHIVSLWNRTDGVQLATTGSFGLSGGVVGCIDRQLVHTATATDEGDQLEIRVRDNCDNASRDFAIDVFSLAVDSGATPFEDFMSGYPSLTGDDALPDADPDADGLSNVEEFIMGGSSPADSSAANRPRSAIVADTGGDFLTYSILTPTGVVFAGSPSPSATVSGVLVTAKGSLDLTTFNRPVEETAVDPSLPAPLSGYAWHTFRLADPVGSQQKGFLRGEITIQP